MTPRAPEPAGLADPIADLRSDSGSLISLYFERPGPGGMGALLTDLMKPLREEAERQGGPVHKSVRADAERIHDLAEKLEVDAAPGYVIFASDADSLFLLEPLTHAVPNVSHLGPRPYLRPLRAAPRPLRAGVIVGDRVTARAFVGSGHVVEELASREANIGKPNYGGFGGYEEHSVRSHAEEETTRMWKEAGTTLLERHLERPFDFLAVGGHEETFEDIGRTLHPYLARLERSTFTANPQTSTPAALRAQMADLASEVRWRRQAALAEQVCSTARAGGMAVLGLAETLQSCNAQAVDTLVVGGTFTRPGVMCNQCGFLARVGEVCPVCSAPMFALEDVVAAAMDATVNGGGAVHQIEVASQLDVDGVGAIVRFHVAI